MGLSRRQRSLASRVVGEAQAEHASPRELKALLEAGIVESNLRNLPGGSADSTGFLQQRPSQGWGPAGEGPVTDTRQFLAAARKVNRSGFHGSAGQLAQAVQRSAFPGRYDQHAGDAVAVLRDLGAGGAIQRSGLSSGDGGVPGFSAGPVQGFQDQVQAPSFQLPDAGVAAPSFTAGPVLPQGAPQIPQSGAPAPAAVPLSGLAGALSQGQNVSFGSPGGASSSGGAAVPRAAADLRPSGGYKGSEGAAHALATVGLGLGLQVTSTKRHNTNPYSGTGSDHDYSQRGSYAFDLSNGTHPTPQMDRTAYRLMHLLGDSKYKMGQPINVRQGVFTVNGLRIQIIYRGSGPDFGGNHTNHVHIGVRRVGK